MRFIGSTLVLLNLFLRLKRNLLERICNASAPPCGCQKKYLLRGKKQALRKIRQINEMPY